MHDPMIYYQKREKHCGHCGSTIDSYGWRAVFAVTEFGRTVRVEATGRTKRSAKRRLIRKLEKEGT